MTVHRIDRRDLEAACRLHLISADELLHDVRMARLDREWAEANEALKAALAVPTSDPPRGDVEALLAWLDDQKRRSEEIWRIEARADRIWREREKEWKRTLARARRGR